MLHGAYGVVPQNVVAGVARQSNCVAVDTELQIVENAVIRKLQQLVPDLRF
jgi:hypothetical protein